jgi:soluble lytic murein transglycosylase
LQEDSDPLMFIETITNDETRRFVRQVLADSWIYAEEIGLKPTSLDELAEGNFPQLSLNGFATASN